MESCASTWIPMERDASFPMWGDPFPPSLALKISELRRGSPTSLRQGDGGPPKLQRRRKRRRRDGGRTRTAAGRSSTCARDSKTPRKARHTRKARKKSYCTRLITLKTPGGKRVVKTLGDYWLSNAGRREYTQLVFDAEVQDLPDIYYE